MYDIPDVFEAGKSYYENPPLLFYPELFYWFEPSMNLHMLVSSEIVSGSESARILRLPFSFLLRPLKPLYC